MQVQCLDEEQNLSLCRGFFFLFNSCQILCFLIYSLGINYTYFLIAFGPVFKLQDNELKNPRLDDKSRRRKDEETPHPALMRHPLPQGEREKVKGFLSSEKAMRDVTLMEMLKAGVHFGHKKSLWNPKMSPYIFTTRNGIHVLDLEKTKKKLDEALDFAKKTAAAGGTILFVGTKRQAKEEVKEAAESCGMPYVVTRWLGGTFTNFRTIQRTIKKMDRLERMIADDEIKKYTKKEQLMIAREVEKMKTFFSGIKEMKKLPEAIFVLDAKYDHIPVEEARQTKVKVIGLVDTNSDPSKVDYLIPSNDDAIKVIALMTEIMAEAIKEGRTQLSQNMMTTTEGAAVAK